MEGEGRYPDNCSETPEIKGSKRHSTVKVRNSKVLKLLSTPAFTRKGSLVQSQ
jgi:hypothetical protein